MSNTPRLSVIIPCREDATPLARLLAQICGDERIEVIVVCGGDQDGAVADACANYGTRLIESAEVRGARLLKGAEAARASNLWFLHADSVIEAAAIDAVIQAFADGWVGGYFKFTLLGPRNLIKGLIEFSVALRCKLGGIPYGDQALFVTAAEYKLSGGHEPLALFDEFRLTGRLMRNRRFRMLPLPVAVDARRWEAKGFVMHSLKNRFYSLAYIFGVSPARLARWYYNTR